MQSIVVQGGPGDAESSSAGDARARDGRLCPPALPIQCHTLISMIIIRMVMPEDYADPAREGFKMRE